MNSVTAGLDGGPGWTEAQYTLVVDRLAKAPYGAIIAKELYAALPGNAKAAKKAIEAMVQANMLAYRPPSGGHHFAGTCCMLWAQWSATLHGQAPCCAEWARDIPMEAFGPDRQDVVTAPSATHLYCMRRLQRRGALKIAAEVSQRGRWCMGQVHMVAHSACSH